MGAAYDRYRKKTLVPLNIALNRNTDADIIERLEKQPSKAGYVKSLIRDDMKNGTIRLTLEQEIALYNCLLSIVESGYDVDYMPPKQYDTIKSVYLLLKQRSDKRCKPT